MKTISIMRKTAIIAAIVCSMLPVSAITQQEILETMRSSSPLPDITNTDPKIYEEAAAATFEALGEMPWGGTVPDREFKAFVVPLRVNNEPIDAHRPAIYKELKDRVKGLDMADAILEVNHWCHEYLTYQPSDARTRSPLQSMGCGIGRCGEESTFTVAALRAVGIPARQVYTPRWAHTDDNHAWVEAWADGKWHFIGACEPEPVLDMAWFNAPSTRGMMMHTFVRGDYDGPEEVVERRSDGVNINVTSNYAPVAPVTVTVLDENGKPVQDADVTFRIYNYAEYYPLTGKKTDNRGTASTKTGLGDMLIWAAKGGRFAFAKADPRVGDHYVLTLRYAAGSLPDMPQQFDMTPPAQGTNLSNPDAPLVAANKWRLEREDSIRNSRALRFINKEDCDFTAMQLGMNESDLWNVMSGARGNWRTLMVFLQKQPSYKDRRKALTLLKNISAKDLTDVTMPVLQDHMSSIDGEGVNYEKYVLSPRIESEDLSQWRRPLSRMLANLGIDSPESLAEWTAENITIIPDWTPQAVTVHPHKTIIFRKVNARSRDLFYVAAARSLGFPARKDPVTGQVQWLDNDGQWHTVDWTAGPDAVADITWKGKMRLVADTANRIDNPAYYRQFTISKIENGLPRLLEYDENATLSDSFDNPVELDCGDYMLVTGQRLANGGVMSEISFFTVEPGTTVSVPLRIRHDDKAVEVIGSFNSENLYTPLTADRKPSDKKSILATTGRGYYVLGLVKAGHEPSNHTLRDIALAADEFEKAGIPMLILLPSEADAAGLAKDGLLAALPKHTALGVDSDGIICDELRTLVKNANPELPIFVIADTFNRVVFVSDGYTIGLGHSIIDTLRRTE